MTWEHGPDPVRSGREMSLAFAVRDAAGGPVSLEPYMGMGAHAVVLARDDGSVFVHLHPMGTVSMASMALLPPRRERVGVRGRAGDGPRAAAGSPAVACVSLRVSPSPGPYRLWVQVRSRARCARAFSTSSSANVAAAPT